MIDIHTHAIIGADPLLADEQLAQCGCDCTILAAAPLDHWGTALNSECADMVERVPERLVGLIGIHPPAIEESLRQMDEFADRGFKGIKLMPTAGYYPDDEAFRPIFAEANRRGWLCLSHCGWCSKGVKKTDLPQSTKYAHPVHVEALARIYGDIDFILAHGGGRTGYQTAWELSNYHPNIYVDTCPGHGPWTLKHAPKEWLDILPWKRLLLGTDTLFGEADAPAGFDRNVGAIKTIIAERGYKTHWEDVAHNNAARLLKRHGILPASTAAHKENSNKQDQ